MACWHPFGDCRLTRSHGPLPLASIRTGLCISLSWEESPNCHTSSAEQLCPRSVLELNAPKVGTGRRQRDRASVGEASSLDGHVASPRCSVWTRIVMCMALKADRAPCPPALSPRPGRPGHQRDPEESSRAHCLCRVRPVVTFPGSH